MGEATKIQWCDSTFNPWRGCQKAAAGCANCYAESQAKRNPNTLGIWGPSGTRVVASESMWREPAKWNKVAACCCRKEIGDHEHEQGCPQRQRHRVFCGSMMDWAEDWDGQLVDSRGNWAVHHREWGKETTFGSVPLKGGNDALHLDGVRRRLFRLIDDTPNLDWLLLTKRPENIRRMWCDVDDPPKIGTCTQESKPPKHRSSIWLGTSIACQQDADRNIPEMLKCCDLSPVLFLSIEPLVGPVDLSRWFGGRSCRGHGDDPDRLEQCETGCGYDPPEVDWVIVVGGESGPNARPCRVEWIRSIVKQCREAGVKCFVKQLGANVVDHGTTSGTTFQLEQCWPDGTNTDHHRVLLRDRKGGDPAEWPEDLRVREFPTVAGVVT